jgi:hypothetical protein
MEAPPALRLRVVDADHLPTERVFCRDGGVNSFGLPREVQVDGARDDAGVVRSCVVQADEVFAIQGQNGPVVSGGETENSLIRF